eukprot:309714-Pyramimonas_sp.AAC.1
MRGWPKPQGREAPRRRRSAETSLGSPLLGRHRMGGGELWSKAADVRMAQALDRAQPHSRATDA